ncbi:XDH1 [Auxenochlorella protothecoides x Auxenochlorella symbiontica]
MVTASSDVDPIVYINGKRYVLPPGRAEWTLLQYLREVGLTGTKLGCGEGGCGACTVMVSTCEPDSSLLHRAVNACLCPLYGVEGAHVVTVEGLGNPRDGLHPVQARLALAHGSQCGFCTPGFVMSMYALLRSKPEPPTEHEIEEALAGNLCRCTGYRPILDAFRAFAKVDPGAYTEEALAAHKANGMEAPAVPAPTNGAVCPSTGKPCDCGGVVSHSEDKGQGMGPTTRTPGKQSAEPIFPAELRRRRPLELSIPGPQAAWFRPTTLDRLLELKKEYPHAKLVIGNTEVGIELKFKHAAYPVLIGVTHVAEMNELTPGEKGVTVGASVTLTRLMESFAALRASVAPHQRPVLAAVVEQLRYFAGPPIRNTAGLGGNVATASPISDLNPLWMAAGATFFLRGRGTPERAVSARDFFLGYRTVDMQPHEVLVKIFVPYTAEHEYIKEFKQAHRRDDDIAIVNAGIRIRMAPSGEEGAWVVADASLAFGGVAAKSIMAPRAAAALVGQPLDPAAVQRALAAVREEVVIAPSAPGGMVEFRQSLVSSFLFKAIVHAAHALAEDVEAYASAFPPSYASAITPYSRPPSCGLQYHSAVPEEDVVGQPYRHMAADLQVCGEAQYTDDIPPPPGTLHAALVPSTQAHARLLGVDKGPALLVPGVVGVFTAEDVPGGNDIGAVAHDEELFATEIVPCVGHPIGVVVAETEAAARAGARAVAVRYEPLPALLDIDDAIAAGSFIEGWGHSVHSGDCALALEASDVVLEGWVKMGGQEHFYLEPNASLVIPGEGGEVTSFSSSQCPDKHHRYLAHVLGLPMHKVTVRTKRLGGGFGGKETRSAFVNAAAAVPAHLLRRPVRICLDRDEDMHITGQRHAFAAKYRIGLSSAGEIRALDVDIYNNAGYSLDLSFSIMDRALTHIDSVYRIPAIRAQGWLCKTNQSTHTAFRGFGGPQGMLIMEQIMERVAKEMDIPLNTLRERNMYNEGDVTHFGQRLEGCQARRCWEEVHTLSGWAAREADVAAFNAANRFRKRGLSLLPTKFGISFTTKFMNQAGALIHCYTDGTVLVTHGGVEMGQGLHTKVAQVVAHALQIPLAQVYIAETATDKIPNASPTAASASSDLYGAAAADACAQLNARLEPYRAKLQDKSFKDIVNAAYLDRVDLSAHGFYSTPDIGGFGSEKPYNYFCYGAAVAEVEVDTLTGDFHVLRADVVMDVGKSLNPAIDIGQVEGAFVQGMGWSCIEELVWGDKKHPWVKPGWLFTRGPGTYKIPSVNDIPVDFRVMLLRNSHCHRTPQVHSSKAVGEPPFYLGASVFFALKNAAYAARQDAGLEGWFRLDSPATPERIRMACCDELSGPFAGPDFQALASC